MRAMVDQRYDDRRVRQEDLFSAKADDVAELEAIGLAVRALDRAPTPAHIRQEAEERRDRYARRDLLPKK